MACRFVRFRKKSGYPKRATMKKRLPRPVTILTLALTFIFNLSLFAQEIPTDEATIKAGEALFNGNCKSCHRVKQKLVGPALAGMESRVPSMQWIFDWVRNPAKVIASGDAYANQIYNEYNKAQMTAFTSYTDEQILSIVAYVKAEAEKVEAPPAGSTTADAAGGGGGVPSGYLNAIMIGLVVILVLLLIILGLIINALKRYLDQKDLSDEDREIVHSKYTLGSAVKSPAFIFIVVFLVASITFKNVIDGLYTIGIQQNYQPKQPIAFSHKIHAGQYEIECRYCHTGALKGKQANIPSANMCMNCHSQIREGTNTGTTEINKIYAAIGYDPATGSYTGKQKPIEWVRIHNLPDLAYFNHAQHNNVGGIECQTCHGPIEEMDVVKQYSLLTMGWCIDCHRKTDVNTKGNAYYDKLLELHNSKKALKVEDIGGLECAKCHY
ncbi:MAG: quinol:cytochrome c oxidoreductase pentaheme cytochrome subunit [Bacteroidetes bacterium OLB12]|nr:MAG: quinol:cytochrome c oxidoreductase pentaheme cytochrome subunit [Bacteroidetes bacterium OLB12]